MPCLTAHVFEDDAYREVRRRLIPFLMLCYVFAYLDRVNVSFAKLQMSNQLSFSEAVYGLGAGLFFVGYFIFEVPSNLILCRVGARRWIARIMITWGVLSLLMAFVTEAAHFYVLRFLLGVAEAGFYPGIVLYLTQWFPSERRAGALSLFQSAIPLSGILGGPLSGWIMDRTDGWSAYAGWQWLFILEGTPAIALGIAVYFYLVDDIASAQWLTAAQRQLLISNVAKEQSQAETRHPREIFVDRRVWRLCALVFGLVMGLYGISFWMPTLLSETGGNLSPAQIGWWSAVPNLAAIVAMFLFARSSDRMRERRWHVACAALLGASGLVLTVASDHDLYLAILSLSLAAAGIMSALPMQWSFATAIFRGSAAAAAIALINSVGNLAGAIGPPVLGLLKDKTQTMGSGLYAVAGCVLVAAMIALTLPRSGSTKKHLEVPAGQTY